MKVLARPNLWYRIRTNVIYHGAENTYLGDIMVLAKSFQLRVEFMHAVFVSLGGKLGDLRCKLREV